MRWLSFFETSGVITLLVIFWAIALTTLWIFIYKWFVIMVVFKIGNYSLDLLLSKYISICKVRYLMLKKGIGFYQKRCYRFGKLTIQNASGGLTFLRLASTPPFIGLFSVCYRNPLCVCTFRFFFRKTGDF